jgi:hypothetical protein
MLFIKQMFYTMWLKELKQEIKSTKDIVTLYNNTLGLWWMKNIYFYWTFVSNKTQFIKYLSLFIHIQIKFDQIQKWQETIHI